VNPRSTLTRTLALLGTLAAWLPIAATLATSAMGSARAGTFRMDYLMPAELFPAVIVGGGLLIWAAYRTRRRKRLITGGVAVAVGSLFLSHLFAVVTGLASGATQPTGWTWGLEVAGLAVYTGAVIATGVGGVLLVRDLFRSAGD
jgi:hypothetical protein